MKLEFTKTAIKTKCQPPEPPQRQAAYWDTHRDSPRGFGLIVSRTCATYVVQRKFPDGKTRRVTLGQTGELTLQQARKRAWATVNGDPPARRDDEWRRFTLAQAIDEHEANMRQSGCAQRSMHSLRYESGRLLADWMDRPLVSIRRADCIDRHRKVTEENGATTANRLMRLIRAVWNSAGRRFEELPEHPVKGVRFNRERRKREPIAWGDLPAWADRIDGIGNPIRRDLWWFVLLTGLRDGDARSVRWEHVDFKAGTIHRPQPKGGEDRAFTVPLSEHVLELLRRRRANSPRDFGYDDCGWVWPSWSRGQKQVQPINQLKEQEYYRDEEGRRKRSVGPSPHRLRDTFLTACHECRIHPLDEKVLVNHRLPGGDVTEGYIRPSSEHLRECLEQVTAFLLAKAGRKPVKLGLHLRA